MIIMQSTKTYKILFSYLILIFLTVGSAMSQGNKYEYLIKKGNKLYEENLSLSEQNYRKAISVNPEFFKGQYNFSNNLYENEYYDEALINQLEASKYAKSAEDKHQIFHNIGNILMKKKMCKEAVEAYKNALKNNPIDEESRYNLALAKECAKEQENEKESETKMKIRIRKRTKTRMRIKKRTKINKEIKKIKIKIKIKKKTRIKIKMNNKKTIKLLEKINYPHNKLRIC